MTATKPGSIALRLGLALLCLGIVGMASKWWTTGWGATRFDSAQWRADADGKLRGKMVRSLLYSPRLWRKSRAQVIALLGDPGVYYSSGGERLDEWSDAWVLDYFVCGPHSEDCSLYLLFGEAGTVEGWVLTESCAMCRSHWVAGGRAPRLRSWELPTKDLWSARRPGDGSDAKSH